MEQGNVDPLTEREAQLVALEWIDNRIQQPPSGRPHSQTRSLMGGLAQKCIAESLRNGEDESSLCERLGIAWEILHSAWFAGAPEFATRLRWKEEDEPDEEETKKIELARHIVWERRDPKRAFHEGFKSDQYTEFHTEDLKQEVANYLERPWLQHPYIDWMFVDMLVSRELCAFGEAIKQYSMWGKKDVLGVHHRYFAAQGNLENMTKIDWKELGESFWTRFVWTIILPIGAVWISFHFSYERTAWALIGIYAVVILIFLLTKIFAGGRRALHSLLGRPDPRIKPFKIWDEMYEVWRQLEGPVVSPTRLRQAMERSTE